MSNKQCWGKVSWKKLKERDAQIPCGYVLSGEILDELDKLPNITFISQSENFFTPEEIDIINADAPEIISKTSSGIWTIVEITKAFIKAAMIVHQSTNSLTEITIVEARPLAKALGTPTKRGLPYGLPISLKDNFNVHP